MRLVLLVVGLCAAAALAAEKVAVKEVADKPVELLKKDEMVETVDEIVKLPGSDKTWAESVHSMAPTAELFHANLHKYTGRKIKAEIVNSFDLQKELDHWKKTGNPDHVTFLDDDDKPAYGLMSSGQPVLFNNYSTDIKFHLFTKAGASDELGFVVTPENMKTAPFNPELPLKVIIHGYTNTIHSPVIQTLKNAFLETGKYNVLAMDWGALCRPPWYQTARAHVIGAGDAMGAFLETMIANKQTDYSKIHIIGHSLGAHVSGIAAKSMKSKPARVSGLDPAGPLFELTNPNGILWKDDAVLVDVMHTNAGFLGLGKSKSLGHVDFYPNGGRLQPGCTNDWTGSCSHARVYKLYEFTIRNPDVLLDAFECPLPGGADKCEKHRAGNLNQKAIMGYNVKYDKPGTYYLKTADKPNWKVAS